METYGRGNLTPPLPHFPQASHSMKTTRPMIMASTSATRRRMIANAGLTMKFMAPNLDEETVRRNNQGLDGRGMAQILADAKAISIIADDTLVIGADQTLELNGQQLTKATSISDAREKLKALRGQTHHLHSAASCSRGGQVIYRQTTSARLTMRNFSDDFLETYLRACGQEVLGSVGCYNYESLGIQLFEEVEGDYYTILGLPLLPLLAFLRDAAMLPT
jgi:septum formation protein